MDIYHKNRRFLLIVILLILITAAVISKYEKSFIKLSPSNAETFFQEKLVPGTECKCIITSEDAKYYGELAQAKELTILKSESPLKSDCLEKISCEINIKVKKDNKWEERIVIGTSAYSK